MKAKELALAIRAAQVRACPISNGSFILEHVEHKYARGTLPSSIQRQHRIDSSFSLAGEKRGGEFRAGMLFAVPSLMNPGTRQLFAQNLVDSHNSPHTEQHLLSRDAIRKLAASVGFTDVGVVALPPQNADRDAQRFDRWVKSGRAGTMSYLERTNESGDLVRARVSTPFPWARSAIVCLASYHSAQPRSTDPTTKNAAWIARYAWSSRLNERGERRPSDYHKVLLKRLHALQARMRESYGDFESRAYVDTGPVVERSLAAAAGLGWTAKNTCLIHPTYGSYAFLAVLLMSLEIVPGESTLAVPDRCGTCTRCIDACPTGALDAPYQMDAARCISYLTIEHRGPIAPDLMKGMGRQVFGCDICQDVCPWNRKAPIAHDAELEPRPELINPALEALASLNEVQFEGMFNGSPVRRARFDGLRRNLAIAIGNSGSPGFIDRLREWSQSADEGLQNAANWALSRLLNRDPN